MSDTQETTPVETPVQTPDTTPPPQAEPEVDWKAKATEWESKYKDIEQKHREVNLLDKWLSEDTTPPPAPSTDWEIEKKTLLEELEELRGFRSTHESKREEAAAEYIEQHFSDIVADEKAIEAWAKLIDAGESVEDAAEYVRGKYLKAATPEPPPAYLEGAGVTGKGDSVPTKGGPRPKAKSMDDFLMEAVEEAERKLKGK